MISVVACGPGLHTHFLHFTFDYLDKSTPELKTLPFDKTGIAHGPVDYSKKYRIEHQKKMDLFSDEFSENIGDCVGVEADDILYYERVGLSREGGKNHDLKNLENYNNWHSWNNHAVEKIYSLYKISKHKKIPRFILRDFVKLGHLDPDTHGLTVYNKNVLDVVKKENCVIIPVSAFFTFEQFLMNLKKVEKKFNLDFNFGLLPNLYKKFVENNKVLQTHKIVFDILKAIQQNKKITIPELDVWQEAFIYAELEKNYDFIKMPLVDQFFQHTQQIIDYVTYYPQHYKSMNPNLPVFGEKPNPFFNRQK